jgi:cellulose-binding protein
MTAHYIVGMRKCLWTCSVAVMSALAADTVAAGQFGPPQPVDDFQGKPRAVIISDIGNEPDDQMSFVRLLLYSNEIDLEAIIAATSTWQKTAVHPETMHRLILAYGQVRANLMLHATGWPTAEELDKRVYAGQPAYGMDATGSGKASDGSKALLESMKNDDARPLWICVWGGANTLAQALMDLQSQVSGAELNRIVARLRVYSISDQDDAGPWIRQQFPALFYIVSPSRPNGDSYYFAT